MKGISRWQELIFTGVKHVKLHLQLEGPVKSQFYTTLQEVFELIISYRMPKILQNLNKLLVSLYKFPLLNKTSITAYVI